MFIEKKICLEFDEKDKDVLQKMIDMKENFKNEDVCDYLACCDCPFENICNSSYDTADEIIEDLNENI